MTRRSRAALLPRAALLLVLGLAGSEAHALCFDRGLPGPCGANDRSVRVVERPDGSTMLYGTDRYSGNPWRMLRRSTGLSEVYTGTANGGEWTIIEQTSGDRRVYRGIAGDGRRFAYSCTSERCGRYDNPTSIQQAQPPRIPSVSPPETRQSERSKRAQLGVALR